MSQTIKEKAKADLEALQKQLDAKKHLLQEVFCDLKGIERVEGKQLIGEILGIEPRITPSGSTFCKCTLLKTTGFEDFVCVAIRIQNLSPQCYAIVQGRPCHSNSYSSYLLFDNNESEIETIPPGKDGTLLISFPQHLLINSTAVQVVVDCSWTLASTNIVSPWMTRQLVNINSAHPFESFVILVSNPCKWTKLDDIRSCPEEEAVLIKTLASVCFHNRRFPGIALHTFREIFPKLEICDYGYWQLLIGREEFSGVMIASSCKNNGILDIAYSRCATQLYTVLNKLKEDTSHSSPRPTP